MICPFCGAEVQDGSGFCMSCGNVLGDQAQAQSTNPVNDSLFSGNANNMYTPGPDYSSPAPAKKSGAGLVIAIISILAICAVAFGLFWFVFGGKYMGTYSIERVDMTYLGQSMSMSPADMGMSSDAMQIKVGAFNSVKLSSNGKDSGAGKIKFSGDTFTMSDNDISFSGTWNASDKTMTLSVMDLMNLFSDSDLSAMGLDSSSKALLDSVEQFDIVFKK